MALPNSLRRRRTRLGTTLTTHAVVLVLLALTVPTTRYAAYAFRLPTHNTLPRRSMALSCGQQPPSSFSSSSSPICWSGSCSSSSNSRRDMLRGSVSAAAAALMAPHVFRVAGAHAEEGNGASMMADPGPPFARAARTLRQQSNEIAARSVTNDLISEYRTNGVVKVPGVLSEAWLDALRKGCETAQDEAGPYAEYLQRPTDAGLFFTDLELARRLPVFSAFSLYGPAAAVAGHVTGSSSMQYLYDQLFVKQPGVSTETPWHQDGGYWRVRGDKVASVFCPLDDVAAHDGLQFVAGSHQWPLHNPQHFCDGTPYRGTSLPTMPDVTEMVQRAKVKLLTFDLKPGDVLVFSANTVHGGAGNWGRALSTRWVGDGTRFWDRSGEGAIPTFDVPGMYDGDLLAAHASAFPTSYQGNTSQS